MGMKKKRLSMIWNTIHSKSIRSQDDLQKHLADKGIEVTQATLSRDIRELKIVKKHDGKNGYIYVLPVSDKPEMRLYATANKKLSIEFSGNMAVIKTPPGYAMAMASDIDRLSPDEILGTIAGDDAILIIPREGYSRTQISNALAIFLSNKSTD